MKRARAARGSVGGLAEYAFEHASTWMAAADGDLKIVAANAAWRGGFAAEDAVGRPLSDFLGPDLIGPLHGAAAPDPPPVMEAGEFSLEVRVQWSGEVALAALTDVTARATADRGRDAARRARAFLLDAAGVTGVHFDPDTGVHSLTEEFADAFGRSGVSFKSEELSVATHPEDVPKTEVATQRVVELGATEDLEVRSRAGEGGWARIRLLMRPGQRLPSGKYEVFTLAQDVTALANARDRAQAKARQLGLALRAAKAAVYEVDHRNRTVDCSPEFICMVGRALTFEQVKARRPIFETPDTDAFEAMRDKWRGGGHLDARIVREGQERWVRIYSESVCDPDGIPINTIGLMLDIDDAKRQELALQAAQEAAEAATEAKSRFLASMSHEIRTPMNGVVGVLHLLKEEPVSEDGRRLLDEALACADMLSQLINDVLDFSKIEAGKLEIAPRPSSIRAALEGVIALLGPQAQAKAITLRCDVAPELDWAMVDPVRLRQCLFNLVGNAVKFTDAGEVAVRVRRAGPTRLRVEVADTGAGVPLQAQNRLFQRFEQAECSAGRSLGGTGLGLAITRNLVELMEGEIGFRENEPCGSVFWFEIEAPQAVPEAPEADAGGEATLGGLRVLLVDDNQTNRLIGAKVLEALGADATLAEGGLEAIEAVQRESFDLVLMDINMPGVDGLEAVRRMRGLPNGVGALPVLALTANVMAHQRESYLAAGMDGVVGKPFSPGELLREALRATQGRLRLRKAS